MMPISALSIPLSLTGAGGVPFAKASWYALPPDAATARGHPMNVLLLSMPDSFEHMAPVAIRMPNGALTSLAGNVDAHHRVSVADLILVQGRVRQTVTQLIRDHQPVLVGLSVMT